MAKSSKIIVSARTEAAFKKAYKYKNKSLQAFINALLKDVDTLTTEVRMLATQNTENPKMEAA